MAYETKCACGARTANFHFRDNLLPEQVVEKLYCPACSSAVTLNADTMVADNGWIISYDMDLARSVGPAGLRPRMTPGFLFDEGYCTWNGMYPGDHIDSVREREEIKTIAKTDPREYLNRLKFWATERVERLRHEGWRKAKNAA
jgi:hypothetical protein